jgi:ABC-type sugar transport system ATPase subunit
MAEVALERVSREYSSGSRAVDNVSFTVLDRELLVLVGPSGCGKSTTLRMIAGLEPLSAGHIRIAGRVVNDVPPRDRDLAMVFQNYALYPHMTVRANMAFALKLRYDGGWLARGWRRLTQPAKANELKIQRRSIDTRVTETARVLGIEHLLERLPGQLSGGERQRVALGRAIVRQPVAFLFDEPLSNLDARLRVEMRRELKELHQRLGATMIYVTHDQVEALTLGDRIALMDHGVLQQIGTPAEVYDAPRNTFVAGFLGTPPMNLLPGVWREADDGMKVGSKSGLLVGSEAGPAFVGQGIRQMLPQEFVAGFERRPRDGASITLGVRPEDVSLIAADGDLNRRAGSTGDGIVSVVEALGDTTLVSVRLAGEVESSEEGPLGSSAGPTVVGKTMVGKLPPRIELKLGDRVKIQLNPQRLHLFDSAGVNLKLQV